MAQCINTYCLHQQQSSKTCEKCGCSIMVNGWLLPTRVLGRLDNPFSSQRTHTVEAINTTTQESVILRVVHSDDPNLVKALTDSVIAIRQVHSLGIQPHIMTLIEGGHDSFFTWKIRPEDDFESMFVVAQKVEGLTLRQWLEQNAPINEALAVRWLRQLLTAVDKLHSAGFIHRDVKPENIIVGPDEQLVLVDFDSICRIDSGFISTPERSSVMGTNAYMAPEQASGQPRPSSDYYSVGLIIVELLLGQSYAKLSRDKDNEDAVEWPAKVQISRQLRETLESLTHPAMFRRPVSASKVLRFLERADEWGREDRQLRRRRSLRKRGQVVAVAIALLSVPIATASFSAFQKSEQVIQDKEQVIELLSEANRQLANGYFEEALEIMQRAVAIDPRNVTLLSTLALSQYLSGDVESALSNYEKALEIAPNDPITLYDYAITLESVDMDRAISNYQSAIGAATEQNNPIVKTNAMTSLARAYLLQEQTQQAANLLVGLVDTTEDPVIQSIILKNQAWANFKLGNLMAAEEQLIRAIDLNRRLADAHCLLALVRQKQGVDNFEPKVFCQQLPEPVSKPEVNRWKELLGITTTASQ